MSSGYVFPYTLTGAYGRDYKTKQAVLDDWHGSKDFIATDPLARNGGGYVNKADVIRDGWSSVMVRYNKNRNVTRIPVATVVGVTR